MNVLLIYNSNVPLALKDSFNEFGTSVSFVVLRDDLKSHSFTIDKKMSDDFILNENEIEQKKYDIIFIPYSLSEENYTEFLGLRLAYHIRLTPEFNNIQTPIVFYGLDSTWEINRLSTLGQILFTANIFSTDKISSNNFKKQIDYINTLPSVRQQSDDLFLKDFAAKTSLKAPGNYKSHHSIDNELALLRWSTYLNCDDKIKEVKNNLKTNLYFKYINALNPIEKIEKGHKLNVEGKSNILLIDDESNKGWGAFYKSFFEFGPSVDFSSLEIEFKGLTQDEVIKEAIKEVKAFNADVVLLDLRLCDTDFQENILPDNLSGIKILKKIKEINRGIQVIITTASDKVWNYRASDKANGYIIKSRSSEVSADMKHLQTTINSCVKRSESLKTLYSEWKTAFNSNADSKIDFNKEANTILEMSWELIDSGYTDFGYLSLFQLIENFAEKLYEIGEKQDTIEKVMVIDKSDESNYKWCLKYIKDNCNNSSYFEFNDKENSSDLRKPTTLYKISCLFKFKYDKDNDFLKKIGHLNSIRNKIAHNSAKKVVTTEDIKELLKMITIIKK
ncbi:MAG: hypothetical protein GX999_08985 [Bacteroidales bacterium]|nr:hypothetical protein [Bacteroidales bacterium]